MTTAESRKQTKPRRYISVDLFRGFLLMVMVLDHFMLYFGNEEAATNWFYFLVNDGIAGWGAGGFLIMMGMSQTFSSSRIGVSSEKILFRKALLRGTYIFIVGLLMLLLAFGPDDMWRWDILTIIGVSTILLYFCRFIPNWLILLFILAVVLISPALRSLPISEFEWDVVFIETPLISEYISGMFVDPTAEPEFFWRFDHIVKGFFLWGEFPIFPWIVFPLLGFVIGRRIINKRFNSDIPYVLIIGFLLLITGFVFSYLGSNKAAETVMFDYISPFNFYPVSFSMNLYQIGVTLVVFTILFYIYDVKKMKSNKPGFFGRILQRTSNFSLSFYFIHYLILGWSTAIYLAFKGEHLLNNLNFIPSLTFGVLVLLLLEILIFKWEKAKSKYSLEWLLTKLTKKVFPDYERN